MPSAWHSTGGAPGKRSNTKTGNGTPSNPKPIGPCHERHHPRASERQHLMLPRQITQADFQYFEDLHPRHVTYAADNETVEPCAAIVTDDVTGGFAQAVNVPWVLDEIDLANLARGGTLWLTCLTGLPAHYLHVQPPIEAAR